MPQSKIDSKCFNLTKKVDKFLSLSNFSRTDLTPPDFWRELASDEESVSRYIVCLIAKLISLDSDNGLKNLSVVYRDLVEMPVDHSKYKQWAGKPLPTNCRSSALELQYAIVSTIKHLKDCHGYTPSIHLRAMYLRWNLARNFTTADGATKADEFEQNVIRNFSVAQAKEVIRSPLNSPVHKSSSSPGSSDEIDEYGVAQILVEECYANHKRASFGNLPPGQCRLCSYSNAQDGLSYVRLRDMVSRRPSLLPTAIQHVMQLLKSEVSHSQDLGDREALLPLLHLFRELLTMNAPIDVISTYQLLMEFYMWPVAHAEFTRRVLDLILLEGRSKGTNFRRKLMSEQDMGMRPRHSKIRGQMVHMLVDTSHPLSRGALLHDICHTHQDRPDQKALQRLMIRNIFRSNFSQFDVVQLEEKLLRLSSESLRQHCLEAAELLERQAGDSTSGGGGEEKGLQVTSELERIHKSILQCAESDEQRDSAVSCSSHENDSKLTEDYLSSFILPTPHLPSTALDNTQYPTVLTKLREVLIRAQQKTSPRLSHVKIEGIVPPREGGGGGGEGRRSVASVEVKPAARTLSSSSADSIGSTNLERHHGNAVAGVDKIANGHVTNGTDQRKEADHMTNGIDHVTEDVDHVTANGRHKLRPSSVPDGEAVFGDLSPSPPPSNGSIKEEVNGHSTSETPPSPISPTPPPKQLLVRRMTCPSGMINQRNSPLMSSLGGVSPLARRYPNASASYQLPGRTMSIISAGGGGGISPLGNGRVKIRANPSATISIKRKQRKGSLSTVSQMNQKLVKVVLAGNDILLSHAARAYCHLRCDEPNLLNGLDVRFYHIPLSRASLIHSLNSESAASSATPPDLPEPLFEQIDSSGNDVHVGRFLSHMDSWYERNVMIAAHHLLRLVPSDMSASGQDQTDQNDQSESVENQHPTPGKTSLTPAKMLLEVISNFTREASNVVKVKMFKVKMSLKSERSIKIEHRIVHMFQKLDIQRISGKKQSSRQVKTFEANLTMTELALDDSLLRSDMMEMKDVWSIRASNMPRAGDPSVPNPESEAVEVTVTKALTEGGRFASAKHRLQEELQYHIREMVLETREKPFSVMVDGDLDGLVENVIRLELSPALLDTGITPLQQMSMRRTDVRLDRQLYFPLMTFWPIDL